MHKIRRLRRLTIIVNIALLFFIAAAFAGATDTAKTNDNDDISEKIAEEGKSVDEISSSIEKSTNGMEDDIEKAGKAIDSPEAEKRLEIAGESIDELSDKMDKETEEKGRQIEDSVKIQGSDEEDKASPESNTDKHQTLRQKPMAKTFIRNNGGFDKQQVLQQKLEDAVEIQGQRVEEIGKSIENKKRNNIQHVNRKMRKRAKRTRNAQSRNENSKAKNTKDKYRKNKGLFIKSLKKKTNKGKYVNKNATKRRVIVPVKRKKLEKLMLYYYVTEKMKNGELPVHNLEKFFNKLDDFSQGEIKETKKQPDVSPDLGGLVKMLGGSAKEESGVKTTNEKASDLNSLSSFVDKIKQESSEANSDNEDSDDTKKPDLDSFIRMLDKRLKTNEAAEDEGDKEAPKKADLKSLVSDENAMKVIRPMGVENDAMSTSSDEGEDSAKLKDMEGPKTIEKTEKTKSEADITKIQVQKMLKNIAEINATLLYQGKKKKRHKKEWNKEKRCMDQNCFGRDIITLLDKALHEVQKDKSGSGGPKTVGKSASEGARMSGEARSKSDPYAGIGEALNQDEAKNAEPNEMTSQSNRAVQGESRHMEPHGSDIVGTSQPIRNRMIHGHHDDDDDDDDDEDEDDEHEGHIVHGYHFPLPMQQDLHHVHHHVHHMEHEPEIYEHHGYHGNQLPISMDNDHEHGDLGYTPPLNVDTAPMHHYPDRHIHDHLDIDSMLRGHPYPHHHHTPEVSLEGPISLAPVYEDMHHMLNGPGIHDQTDVHYEVEMHAHPYHHGYGHHGYDNHGDDHHDDDHYDENHHHENDHYYHEGYHHERGYDHDDHDHNDHHDDDDYHDDYNHGDDHEHGINGEKKHLITAAKKKSTWRAKKTKTNKNHILNKSSKKSKRLVQEEDDEDDDRSDDVVENIPRNGYGVSRLSYLTEQNGETMEHEIGEGIKDVEDVGRSIEDSVQHGVDRVTELSNGEVEAPDYDHEGHMEPNVHREDIKDDDD